MVMMPEAAHLDQREDHDLPGEAYQYVAVSTTVSPVTQIAAWSR